MLILPFIPSWAARTSPSRKQRPPAPPLSPRRAAGIRLLLRHGADKILRFLGGIVALCSPCARSLITAGIRWGRAGDQSAVIFFKTGPNAFLLIAVAGLISQEKLAVWHCSVRTPDKPAEPPFRISDLSCHISTRKDESARPIGAPPPVIHAMRSRSISMSRPLKERIHLERLAWGNQLQSLPSIPSGSPHQPHVVPPTPVLHIVISRWVASSWSFKSVTVLLSSRAAAPEQNQRGHVSASSRFLAMALKLLY